MFKDMDANIHIDQMELSRAFLEFLAGCTLEITMWDGNMNYIEIKDEYGRRLVKPISIVDNRTREE